MTQRTFRSVVIDGEESEVNLNARRALCQAAIAVLEQVNPSDPRRAGALEEYKKQLAEIDAKIAALTGKPPDVVVGLKSAQLSAKVQ